MASDRGHETRERLLRAAAHLAGEVGWGNVTTRLVAERAGVNAGVVHYHFSSVTNLLVEACSGFTGELLDDTLRRLTEQPDVASGVDWLLAELAVYAGDDPATLIVAEAFLAASRHPDLRARLAGQVAAFRGGVADWLRAHGNPSGADAAATVLAAAIDGLVLHRVLDPALDLTTLAGALRGLLDGGRS